VSQGLPKTEDEVITVSEKDTLWDLATKIYGDGRLFAAVHEANRDKLNGQAKLTNGLKLRFPAKAQLLREFRAFIPQDILDDSATPSNSDSSNRREYTTRNGDTLFSIAREELGQASRYVEILELNSTQLSKTTRHGDELAADLMLELPAK
jgi:nucleoid-associated protein YgaU